MNNVKKTLKSCSTPGIGAGIRVIGTLILGLMAMNIEAVLPFAIVGWQVTLFYWVGAIAFYGTLALWAFMTVLFIILFIAVCCGADIDFD